MIETTQLSIGYRKGRNTRQVQTQLGLHAGAGELVAILGPNGCGKSTLLRTLGGLQEPLSGSIRIGGNPLQTLSLHNRARIMSLVLTEAVQVVYITVYEMVAMGRHPYTTLTGKLSEKDESIIHIALEAVRMTSYTHRFFQELSDGERQRVMVAKALAQDTPVIFLDEPTSHLDLPNRIEMMLLLRKLSRETGKTILLSTHEIDLALRLADYIWLMKPQGGVATGSPADLMQQGVIQAVFHSNDFGFDPETGRVIIF